VVSLHCPLTAQTRGLIDRAAIATMRPGAVLINAARGGIVDEAALIEALREGRLAGAAIDAFEQEPLGPTAHYDGVPNLILTPHIAGVTRDSERRVNRVIVDRVLAALAA
jgi:(S)-sulfolactate dehydrogenase